MTNMMETTGMDAMHTSMHQALEGSVPADVLAACDEAKQAANTAGCKAVDAGVAALSKTDDLSGDGIKKPSGSVL